MNNKSFLSIRDLHAAVEGKEILKGISFTVKSGQIHAIMGPNGSGKSTLAYSLMNHPGYTVRGSIKLNSHELAEVATEGRAKAGLYLALQSPIAIQGVSIINLLRTAYQQIHTKASVSSGKSIVHNPILARRIGAGNVSMPIFMTELKQYAKFLDINESFLQRGVHDGFSGGEKKKIEMLQALVLKPKFAVFDEIDTGLDVDALKTVASGIKRLAGDHTGVLVITHYQRILKYLKPDVVHVLVNGKIVLTGNADLAKRIEEQGYKKYSS